MINVAEILKQVPKGTKLWSNNFGDVEFSHIEELNLSYPISVLDFYKCERRFNKYGYYYKMHKNGECTLWPSKDHRAWDTEALCILGIEKKPEVPFGLKPFDKVLVRDNDKCHWIIEFFSNIGEDNLMGPYQCMNSNWEQCIPYNDETKHLLNTTQMPPEKYRQ